MSTAGQDHKNKLSQYKSIWVAFRILLVFFINLPKIFRSRQFLNIQLYIFFIQKILENINTIRICQYLQNSILNFIKGA